MVIIDTSVAFKWFDEQEQNREAAIAILQDHLHDAQSIAVPDLFLYEIANAWSTKSTFSISEVKSNLQKLQEYHLEFHARTFGWIEDACELAKTCHVSVYDAAYAVLAQKNDCTLITADATFVHQVNLPFIKLLGQ